MEYENLRGLTHYQLIMTPRTLKTVAKYLVSISVFTFIYYSQYFSWCCFMLHSLKFYLSAIPLHTLDKRWTFLICNGILVVLASTSGLVSSRPSPVVDLNDRMVRIKICDYRHISPPAETKDKWLAEPIENAVAEVEEEEEKEIYQEALEEEEYGKSQDDQCFQLEQGGLLSLNLIEEDHEEEEVGGGVLVKLEGGGEREAKGAEIRTYYALEDDHHQETEEDLEAAGFLAEDMQVEEEEEEEAEHGMEKLSADELNKKFEDFIRKMKEELRIEAQQQLVVVVK